MIKINNRDCTTAIKGTAVGTCQILLDYISKVILFEKNLKLDLENDTFDSPRVQELIQQGKLVVLPQHISFENQSAEDVYETYPSGEEQFVRYGVKKFAFSFSNGICFGNALASLSSKKWDVGFVDTEGKLIVAQTTDGIKGFSTAFVKKGAMTLNDGSVSTKDTLVVGFSMVGTKEFNESIAVVYPKDSVDWLSLEGIHDVRLEVVDAATAGQVSIAAYEGCSGTLVEGLGDSNYWSDGTTQTGIAVVENNGIYTFTLAAGTHIISLNGVIIDASGDFYRSNEVTVTIA